MSYPGYPGYPGGNPSMPQPGLPYPQQPSNSAYPQYPNPQQPSGYGFLPSGMPVPDTSCGGYPQNPGSYPPNPGAYPQNPGSYPPNPGAYPQNPGTYPSNPADFHPPSATSAQVCPPPSYSPLPTSTGSSSSSSGSSQVVYPSQASTQAATNDPDLTLYYTSAKKHGDSGTVHPMKSQFNPEADATQIRTAIKSTFSVNESVLVNILPHRSNAQRQKIRLFYKTITGKDLIEDCRTALTGWFESVTCALLMTPAEYDAYLVNKAVQGAGTDEDALIEIFCTRNNTQIKELVKAYREIFKASVEQDMKDDSGGNFRRMLISLANGARQEEQAVNLQKAEDDAKKLYHAGAGRLGTDESVFNSVFVSQSIDQLRAVFQAYQRLYKKDMEKVIKSEMSGDLESGMKTIVRFTMDKHAYFANQLFKAMKGLGTNERALIRTIVSRSEIDLEQIKRSFISIGEGKNLQQWVKSETSGSFREMLLHIIGN